MAFVSSCPYPTRPTRSSANGRRRWDESDWAEQVAYLRFVEDFKSRFNGGVFIAQRDYLTQQYPSDPNTQTLFDMMGAYFRNWVPPGAFRKNPSTRSEGGMRKPDGMGISPVQPDKTIVSELIEVKPADRLDDGKMQLHDELTKLQDGMKSYLNELRTIQSMDPGVREDRYRFVGSPFVPRPQHLTFPLFSLSDQSPAEISWVCYRPTVDLRRYLGQFTPPDPDTDGIILYHIHAVDLRRSVQAFNSLPKSLRQAVKQAFVTASRQRATGPSLVPWATSSARAAKNALRDRLLIAGAVVVVGLVLLCVFQPEFAPVAIESAGGLAEAAGASTAADEALASSMVDEVFTGYRVPMFYRVAGESFATHDEALDFALDVVDEMQSGSTLQVR
jgi:hypothetical protein